MSIRVLVADDQPIVRSGLTMLLDAQPDIEVIGAAADGREAVRLARQLRPDVGLFDIRMPVMDGIEATRQLAGPDVENPLPIVVITTFDLDEYVHGALKAGARGFLLKDAGPALLTQAIHAAAEGDALIAPSVTVRLLATFATSRGGAAAAADGAAHRTRRGSARHRRQGRTNDEIASELFITTSTVKAHLASLMRKLGARNRVEVAMWAHETGRV
jgi:DNA-binding NarL/FixJ family response regulator